jgi:hypothetical protein
MMAASLSFERRLRLFAARFTHGAWMPGSSASGRDQARVIWICLGGETVLSRHFRMPKQLGQLCAATEVLRGKNLLD